MDRDNTLYPLTHPQKRIWYIEKIYPGTSVNNIGGTVRAEGDIDYEALERAIYQFVEDNDGVRTRLKEVDGQPLQYIGQLDRHYVDFVDFSIKANPEVAFSNWVLEQSRKPFVMEDSPLFYFAIFKIREKNNGYYVKFHHMVCDGWSIKLMTEQISQAYNRIVEGEANVFEKKPQYLRYILREKEYLESDKFYKNREFWMNKFSELPEDTMIGKINNLEGRRESFQINENDSKKVFEYVRKNRVSLNTLFTAAVLIYLNITKQQEDITVGIPVLNRSGNIEKKIIGMFTSTVPLRIKIDVEDEVDDFVRSVGNEMKKCLFRQRYPYNLLIQDLELKKKGHENLFDICVNYYNTRLDSKLDGITLENIEIYNGKQIYPLQMVIKEWYGEDKLTLEFDYQLEHYTEARIKDMFEYIRRIIKLIISDGSLKIKKINLLSSEQLKKQIWDYNNTENPYSKNKSIDRIIDEQAKRTPDRIAVCCKEYELTYKELKNKTDCLARYLISKGVKKGKIVGLMTNHSIETVVGIIGILKAGGAFLPVDLTYPFKRIKYMLSQCNVSIIVANCELNEEISPLCEVIHLEKSKIYEQSSNISISKNQPSDLAYVIYTSGSTGNPKGVLVEHGGLVNYIEWARKTYVKDRLEVFPLYSSLTFDLTITSIFLPLISGGRIIIYRDDDDDEYVLYRVFKDRLATIVKLTPSHLVLIKDMDHRNSSIKRLIVGGEDLKVDLARNIYEGFGGNIEIFNEYGPTEAVVGCMIHKYDRHKDTNISVPIGRPIHNTQIYVLDKYLRPLPFGSVGELYVSGDGVTRGYIENPSLTEDKFILNPFIKGKKMYKTGDLAKFTQDETIEFVGRADRQVKIRGYRIELGEIENHLFSYKSVENAVVTIYRHSGGNSYLCAYIVQKEKIDLCDIKNYLNKFLSNYAIPEYWIFLDTIPLTKGGKVNYRLLPKPKIDLNRDTILPRNTVEKVLLESLTELINVKKIGMKDNFYQLGGDSIKAIQLSSKLLNRGYKIKVKDVMSRPILEEMAMYISQVEELSENDYEICHGSIEPSPITEWFFTKDFQNPRFYTQSVMLDVKPSIEKSQMNNIFQKLIEHHDILRANYDSKKKKLYYNNSHLDNRFQIAFYDFSDYEDEKQKDMIEEVCKNIKSSFSIEKSILFKACAFAQKNQELKLFIVAHHLIVDGVSWRILIEDISRMMEQVHSGKQIVLPAKTCSYGQWCEEINIFAEDKVLEDEKSYWNDILKKEVTFPIADKTYYESSVKNSITITKNLSPKETANLLYKANEAYHTKTNELLIISLVLAVAQYSKKNNVVIELESHGREHSLIQKDLSRTIGWFTSIFPAYFKVEELGDFGNVIKSLKEQIRRIPYSGIGYGILRYLKKDMRDNYENKRLRFNYIGDMNGVGDGRYIRDDCIQFSADSDPINKLTCPIEINIALLKDKLIIMTNYDRNLLEVDTCEKFTDLYIENIMKIVGHCCSRDTIQFTPSDFNLVDISEEELNTLLK
ncbi:amino acid adenylation domain-containing protein [Wukongibacter sp. M2B1]|uniref:amino acid adenylation domain-containing protein n=1 Tax=Wukongibacter sp. M2B1 TaxID=3088895 RepID=UPI003D79F51A